MKHSVLALFILYSSTVSAQNADTLIYPGETHFKHLQQLTFEGDNAEAYFSPDGKSIVFQRRNLKGGILCDQIYYGKLPKKGEKFKYKLISTGKGRTTCSYFMPDGKHILYASTHASNDSCPPVPHIKGKYIWPIYNTFDIYVADLNGKIIKQLTNKAGYDAEATISPKGDKIVFTSTRSGDIELWTMNMDGKNLKQITNELGYDGGAFFSPDGKKIIFRASRPKTEEEIKEYKDFLAQGLVAPTNMELFVCDVDGKNLKQVTKLGKANWAPFFHPSGK